MKGTLPDRVRLGVFEVDLRAGELRQDEGAVLTLPDQPLQILRMLIEADGEMVTRDTIRQRLWPDDTIVEFDQSINTAIKKLRRAMVDSADEPHYIGTIAKRGYRLLVPVERPDAEPDSDDAERTAAPSSRATALSRDDTPQLLRDVHVDAESPTRLRWKRLATVVIVACAAGIGGFLYWRSHRRPKLADPDTILISDFDNKTGDPVFDDTLKQALGTQLSQSPFLDVLSIRKVREILKELNRSASEPLTPDLALGVCRHAGGKAVLGGFVWPLGRGYVLGLKAVDCNTRDVLGEAQEHVPDKKSVLRALDEATIAVGKQMGEPLSSVQQFATPLADATTPSLEAWKAYSVGLKTSYEQGSTAAMPFYKRAAEIDPSFARAYLALSVAYLNRGELQRSRENALKAYELRGSVTERERLIIKAAYYEKVTGELEKAAQAYELLAKSYPKDMATYVNLCLISAKLGNMEQALGSARTTMRLEPNANVSYVNLVSAYLTLNRLNEAADVLEQAEPHKLSSAALLQASYLLAFLREDTAQMGQIASAAVGKPGTEDVMLALEADTEGWYGRLTNARRLTKEAMDSARRSDARETAALYQVEAALREVAAGRTQQVRADVAAARSLGQSEEIDAITALALAEAGDTDESERIANELDKSRPLDTLVQRDWLPTIRAAIALAQKQPNRAIEFLKATEPLELSVVSNLCPIYVRGEAYLMQQNGKAAAVEFQKFLDHFGLVGNFPWGALARLGLARAYALEAQTDPATREKARTAYQDFLTIWRDADLDIPIYKQAKAEYAKLR